MPQERIRLRIGNMSKAVLVTGQAYQDPKDALNEFISNAADEYAEMGRRGGRIRITLRRRGRHPMIAIEDFGRGMDAGRLREVARNLFESPKAGDSRTLGEKAIGILAFQQLGARCDIVSCPQGSRATAALRLERGRASAHLTTNERRRARSLPGTTVYIYELDPDVLRVLTLNKVVAYLRRRRAVALERGDYVIEVCEGRRCVIVTPEQPDGIRLEVPSRRSRFGSIDFYLYLASRPDRRRRVGVAGGGGTTIIDDISELDEFQGPPWDSDQVSGQIVFEALRQSAGRRAVLRDRDAFPEFVAAIKAIEPALVAALDEVTEQVDAEVADRVADAVRRLFGRVLRELEDIDNPMRTPIGAEAGEGGLLAEQEEARGAPEAEPPAEREPQPIEELPEISLPQEQPEPQPPENARPGPKTRGLPTVAPDPTPDGTRSRFDSEAGVVYYNDRHSDYLLVKSDEAALLDYLATLVAKEYVVYNNPRAASDELGEEMVRMLVRVRRHLPRKP